MSSLVIYIYKQKFSLFLSRSLILPTFLVAMSCHAHWLLLDSGGSDLLHFPLFCLYICGAGALTLYKKRCEVGEMGQWTVELNNSSVNHHGIDSDLCGPGQ